MNNIRAFRKAYIVIAIIALLLFVFTFIHPGPFNASIRIPDPRTLLEITLGIIFIVAIALLRKCMFNKPTKIALISVQGSILLYFILRFIHIPGNVLWAFLVLSLVIIIWAVVSVIFDKKK